MRPEKMAKPYPTGSGCPVRHVDFTLRATGNHRGVLSRGETWSDLYFYKFLWDSRWGPFCKGVDFKRDESGVAVGV